jgi:hypothetical protein
MLHEYNNIMNFIRMGNNVDVMIYLLSLSKVRVVANRIVLQ